MTRNILPALLIVLLWPAVTNAKPASRELESRARTFVKLLVEREFGAAEAAYDDTMKRVLPAEKLGQTWSQLLAQTGPFEHLLGTRRQKYEQYDIVFVTCRFERERIDVKLVFDPDGRVAGLFFLPARESYEYEPPPYAKPETFEERDATVGSGEWALPATLSVPRGDSPFAAVVLVHGSGPQDRDETIGPNKPFRDLAWGLASAGIAVLRYEKRTKQYAAKMADLQGALTVAEETVDDAVAAAARLRVVPEVDGDRVFVLGHSLGGTLVPRIARRDVRIAGFIVLAGTTRPLEDVVYDQFEYIFKSDGQVTGEEQDRLDRLREKIETVRSDTLTADVPAELLPLGVPAAYWLDLRGYDPAGTAAAMTRPILILQGERDYQVTMVDFEGWRDALSGRENVQMHSFPELNHLFMAGEGASVPSEYERPGHVDVRVIRTIERWITAQAGN